MIMMLLSKFAAVFTTIFLMCSTVFAQTEEAPLELRTGAQAVIDSQISAFRTQDHAKAFSHAAPSLQKIFGSTDRFIGMVKKGYGAIYKARNWEFGRSGMQSDTLYQEVNIIGPNSKNWSALYTMKKGADGVWRIHGVQMREGNAQST